MKDSNSFKILIAAVMTLLLMSVIAVIFAVGFFTRHRQLVFTRHHDYTKSLADRAADVLPVLDFSFSRLKADSTEMSGSEVFDIASQLGAAAVVVSESGGLVCYDKSGSREIQLKSVGEQKFSAADGLFPARTSDLYDTDEFDSEIMYLFYGDAALMQVWYPFSSLLQKINAQGIEEFLIADKSGIITASTLPGSTGDLFYAMFSGLQEDALTAEYTGYAVLGGKSVIISAAPIFEQTYMITVTLADTADAELKSFTAKLTVSLAATLLLGGALLIYIIRRTPRGKLPVRGASVRINFRGDTVRANRYFKRRYGDINLIDYMQEKGVIALKLLKDEVPLTAMLKNIRSGNWEFVYIIPSVTNRGYRLRVSALSPDTARLIEGRQSSGMDEELLVYSARRFSLDIIAGAENLHSEKGLMLLFDLSGLEHYRIMFGSNFYSDARRIYAGIINRHLSAHGPVYSVRADQLAFLTFEPKKAHSVSSGLKDVVKALNEPVEVGNSLIQIRSECGVVEVNRDSVRDLLNYGSLALSRAKELNKLIHVYDFSSNLYPMTESRKVQIMLEIIADSDVETHFQPQYDTASGKIWGFESLCRIKGRYKDALKVQEFIELAEQSGHMIELGEKLLDQALKFSASVQYFDVTTSLNISPVQLMQSGFVSEFLKKYHSYGLKPGSISMEITETFLMTSFEEVVAKLDVLSSEGIKIHLDDFGVAYSSMLYLKKLPISAIKIDKEFVNDLADNNHSRIICGNIIMLSKELKLSTIAEGVETDEQRDILSRLGCTIIQGFLFGRAVPEQRALALLNKYNVR